jgi:DMSO/TMAO reductase YedYZ heme-binding membrane subunit
MSLVLALAQVSVFLLIFHRPLKRYPWVFYAVAFGVIAFLEANCLLSLSAAWPKWIDSFLLSTFHNGAFPTALFIVVMFLGALDPRWRPVRVLMGVRAEMSIFASLIAIGHTAVFSSEYIPVLLSHSKNVPAEYVVATVITFILLVLMIPLLVTSFPSVRRKMAFAKWKRLHRLSYPFYMLLYAHVMVLFLPRVGEDPQYLFSTIIYTAIYALYAVLRIRRALRKRSA